MLRNRIIYALLLVGSSLLAYYEPNIITSIFFHTMVFLLLVSLVHLIYTYIAVKISQSLDPIVVEHGQKANYVARVFNEGIVAASAITINFLFNETMFKNQLDAKTFTLNTGKDKNFDIGLYCRYRGVYSVGIETLDITDMLNVFKVKVKNIETKNITVLPKVTQIPNFYIAPKSESDTKSISAITAEGANSLVDVQKFKQGDALKHIHWKLSARHDELLVRNLERSAQNSTLIFLDTSRGKYDFSKNLMVEDKLMEALVSVVNQCLIQNHIIEINYNEFNPVNVVCTDRDDFRDFFTNAARVSFMHTKRIKTVIDDYFVSPNYRQGLRDKNIFIFTCHPEQIQDESTIYKLIGSDCTLHIVSCSFSSTSNGAYRASNGIYYYNLSPESELEDVFLGSIK